MNTVIQNLIKPIITRLFTYDTCKKLSSYYTCLQSKLKTRVFATNVPSIAGTPKPFTYPFIAGVLDGDGFIRTYKNTGEYVITMHLEDQPFLEQLKLQFGGYIQKVLGKKAARFHLNAKYGKKTLVDLTNGLNGHIGNSIRVEQFKKLCDALGIEFSAAKFITLSDSYIAGLFCSDGSVYLKSRPSRETMRNRKEEALSNESRQSNQLKQKSERIERLLTGVAPRAEISITCKFIIDIQKISLAFGFGSQSFSKGNSRAPDGHYRFRLYKENDILTFIDYMNRYPSDSLKHKRLNLIRHIYSLKQRGAHLAKNSSESAVYAEWEAAIREWFAN